MVATIVETKSAKVIFTLIEDARLTRAGPPDRFVADGEFSSEVLSDLLGRAGVLCIPSASFAPWQKGNLEGRIQTFRKCPERSSCSAVLKAMMIGQACRHRGVISYQSKVLERQELVQHCCCSDKDSSSMESCRQMVTLLGTTQQPKILERCLPSNSRSHHQPNRH